MELRTRLAPSPTGSLHLGNARTFLVAWLMARRAGGRVLLRVDDNDRARSKAELIERAIADLDWLGLDWDEGPVLESTRGDRYQAAFDRLREAGHLYPCVCTRREVLAAASAPHAEDEAEPRYPGTCRDRFADGEAARRERGRPPAWRFRVPPGPVPFADRFLGDLALEPATAGGDFVVRSFDGTFAYQLATVVDDGDFGITDVVRGADLVPSTPRQLLLFRALGVPEPRFAHLPLLLDASGQRMAKRRGSTELAFLRERGLDSRAVVAWLASGIGIDGAGPLAAPPDLVPQFDLARVPRAPLVAAELPWERA